MSIEELITKANNGEVEAEAELGRQYALKGDYKTSVDWNLKAASHGSGAAMMALYSLYSNGNGVAKNEAEAKQWLIKAANTDNGAAIISLASKLEKGNDGFEYSPEQAFYYIQRLASVEGWSTCGKYTLARYYAKGIGTSINMQMAYNLFLELANEGYGDAQFELAYMFAKGENFQQDMDQAGYWANLALESTKTAGFSDIEKIHSLANRLFDMEFEDKSENNSGGCYIATCVYGSYDCPQVWVLRRYRDYHLSETWSGRAFIHVYYAISPLVVKCFGQYGWFQTFWRKHLDKFVKSLMRKGVENTPYRDKKWR